ncbi:YbjN domain-containing protein [Salana multivorans]|uniref:YbjN domain-containing protein n=1 Tax=Salana multivorans TaxID=120377 RepID=UPI0024916138|nr:YbjN domain-containing protein [Salana multivorans]
MERPWQRWWRGARGARPGDPPRDAPRERAEPDDAPAPDERPADRPHPSPQARPAPQPLSAEDAGATGDAGQLTDATRPRAVTHERLVAAMRRHGYHYLVDERGDLCGLWGYRFFSFHLVRGAILQVRARWTRQGDIERLWELLAICEGWNRRNPYPKCYVRVLDDGRVHVLTETAVPVAAGLTDAQLDHHLQVGLAAGTAVFDDLDRRYPDPVASGPAA